MRPPSVEDFRALESVGERAYDVHLKPDAGLWEFRTRAAMHTYSAIMCWAACDRLGNAAEKLGLAERASALAREGDRDSQRDRLTKAWNANLGRFAATLGGGEMDAELLQMLDMRFVAAG